MSKKLCKSNHDVKISGVCGGIAEYFGLDSTLVRIAFVIVSIFGGSGLILYIACAMIMPRNPSINDLRYGRPKQDAAEDTDDEYRRFNRNVD